MRFLANENFPGTAVEELRAVGHDVLWIRTEAPGAADQAVLERAQQESRILLTFDKDFGELAWRAKLPSQCGIVLFRLPIPHPDKVGKALCQVLAGRHDWAGRFSVVEPGRIRMREIPS
jgi:predicted nuclease of predicted toxin-antitoxin system